MYTTAINYAHIFRKIDEIIKSYCELQKITFSTFANMLHISEASLRNKRHGKTEYTLFEVLKMQEVTGRNILQGFDENILQESAEPYKMSSNKDKAKLAEQIKESIPAPVFNYYITIS